jgi:hypothetical protein
MTCVVSIARSCPHYSWAGPAEMPSNGSILLGEVAQHLASVDIACNFRPRVGKAGITRLMHEHGARHAVPTLLRMLSADCPRPAQLPGPPSRVGCICRAWRACSGRRVRRCERKAGLNAKRNDDQAEEVDEPIPRTLLPCGPIRTSLDYGNLRGQAEEPGTGVVRGYRRCSNLPTVPREACAYGAMIVTNRGSTRRKRPKPAQAAEIAAPRIVQHLPKHRREPKPRLRDPEGEARVDAFFLRMGLTLPDDWAH